MPSDGSEFVDFGSSPAVKSPAQPAPAAPQAPVATATVPAVSAAAPVLQAPVSQPAVTQVVTHTPLRPSALVCEDSGGASVAAAPAPVTNFMAAAVEAVKAPAKPATPAPAVEAPKPSAAPVPQTYTHSATNAQVSILDFEDMDGEIVEDPGTECDEQAPTPTDFTTPVITQPVAPAPAAAPVAAVEDKDLAESQSLWNEIQMEIQHIADMTGLNVLFNPQARNPHNNVHVAIYHMMHNPTALLNMPSGQLCAFEACLSANQLRVTALENEWSMKSLHMGREREMLLRRKRGRYKGDTEKGKEDLVVENEPGMRAWQRDAFKANAMANYLKNMGERFKQLEDGIKRLINSRTEEERRGSGRQVA